MCTARPPSRSPVTANITATIHSLLWPTVCASPLVDGTRGVLLASPVRPCRERGITLPRAAWRSRVLVRGGFFVPRPVFALRGLGRSTLPRLSTFLLCPIVCPILRFASIDLQGFATWLVHAELLRRQLPDPPRTRQFRDPDLESLPFVSCPVKLHVELRGPGVESRGDRVQIDAPQHQEHRHHNDHRKPAPPAGRFPPKSAVRRAIRGALPYRPRRLRRERGLVPALRRCHQVPSA